MLRFRFQRLNGPSAYLFPAGFPVLIILLIPLRWKVIPRFFSPKELRIMDDLTANNEIVLASLGGAPTMLEEKEEPAAMPELGGYRSEEWGMERRYSESKKGVKRQRAGSRGRS